MFGQGTQATRDEPHFGAGCYQHGPKGIWFSKAALDAREQPNKGIGHGVSDRAGSRRRGGVLLPSPNGPTPWLHLLRFKIVHPFTSSQGCACEVPTPLFCCHLHLQLFVFCGVTVYYLLLDLEMPFARLARITFLFIKVGVRSCSHLGPIILTNKQIHHYPCWKYQHFININKQIYLYLHVRPNTNK